VATVRDSLRFSIQSGSVPVFRCQIEDQLRSAGALSLRWYDRITGRGKIRKSQTRPQGFCRSSEMRHSLASAILRAPEPDESAQCSLNGEKLTADLRSHGTQSLGDVEECIVASLHSETEIREREGNGAGGSVAGDGRTSFSAGALIHSKKRAAAFAPKVFRDRQSLY
jgi:hypothetical protein